MDLSRVSIDPDRRTVVRRLRNIFEATPDDVRQAGMEWYERVHDASLNGLRDNRRPGRTLAHAAGVVAAVSPGMDFERNNINAFGEISALSSRQWDAVQRSALAGSRTDEAREALQGLSISTAGDADLMKAHRIWNLGQHYDEVLPRRTAPKTHSFATNIEHPLREGPVTVDGRHSDLVVDAMRPWKSSRNIQSAALSTGKPTRYERYEDATRAAAKGYGVLPHQLQAVVWEHAKQIERGFDPARKKGDTRTGQSYQRRLRNFQAGAS